MTEKLPHRRLSQKLNLKNFIRGTNWRVVTHGSLAKFLTFTIKHC